MSGYDWNGNGQNDAFDSYMDMKVMSDSDEGFTDNVSDDFLDDCNKSIDYISGTSYDKEDNEYSWRENYDYDFDHNIDPEDYETEEEYLEALEEAQIDSASVLRQSNVKIKSPYKVGQTVLHDSFGIGNIIVVKPIGQEFLLDIDFQNIGIKQIFTRYAKLTVNKIEIEKAKQNNKQDTYIFFEDENICISFVKWERNCYLLGGYAKAGTFIFENKSNNRLCIYIKDITVGGFLNQSESLPTTLAGKQKEIKTFPFVYEDKIPELVNNCKTIEFKVCYGTIRDGFSSISFIDKPIIESEIISIKV